jgi:hypothetical protein
MHEQALKALVKNLKDIAAEQMEKDHRQASTALVFL